MGEKNGQRQLVKKCREIVVQGHGLEFMSYFRYLRKKLSQPKNSDDLDN